jgi:hypothetical protein
MAATAQQIPPDLSANHATLVRTGYTVVQDLLTGDEVERLRETAGAAIDQLAAEDLASTEHGRDGTLRASTCDLLSIPSLRGVLLDARLLAVIEQLLGGPPCYFGDSSVRVGKTGTRAWHRDNVDRVRWRGGPDWLDPYPLLRCGLYLQDQARHSGGLALRPCSNRPGRRLPTLPRLVRAKAGDLVAWDLRTVHSGEVVRARGLPGLALNPRLQTRLPESMRVPDDRERIVMFMTFGLPGPHLDHYLAYLKTRDYMRESWISSRFGPDVWEQAERAGLDVLHPTPEYGTPAASG